MAESQLTLDLHLVTCHKYCDDDNLRCDERCGFANMIILYFQGKSRYAENFPWHIPMEVVERIKQKIKNGEIKGNFPLLGIDNSEDKDCEIYGEHHPSPSKCSYFLQCKLKEEENA